MNIVVDASIVLALILDDESSNYAEAVKPSLFHEGMIVPSHWHIETGNVLLMCERRKRAAGPALARAFELLRTFIPTVEVDTHARAHNEVLQLARKHTLTLYDASYLELALRRNAPLATLDHELIKASIAEGCFFNPAA